MPVEKSPVVRMRRETYALFDRMHRQLNERLPYGEMTKAELLELVVSSAHATLTASGQLGSGGQLKAKTSG